MAPIGVRDQVMAEYNGRALLGDVISVSPAGALTVRHFNGEPWPIEPLASEVQLIDVPTVCQQPKAHDIGCKCESTGWAMIHGRKNRIGLPSRRDPPLPVK